MRSARRLLRTRLLLQSLEARTAPAVFTVGNADDAGAGSLRQAILDANAANGADTIAFSATFFNTPRTIALQTALPSVNGPTTISGPGANLLTVRRAAGVADAFRVFDLNSTVTLSGVTVTGGSSQTNRRGGGIRVRSAAIATVADSVVTGNTSRLAGGGIFVQAYGHLTVRNCTLSGNSITPDEGMGDLPKGGGGLATNRGATVVLENTTVSGNTATRSGGGIYAGAFANLTVRDSTVSGNTIGTGLGFRYGGGGVYFREGGTLLLENSTVSGNSCPSGGGGVYLYASVNAGTFTFRNSTIANNTAATGGGLRVNAPNGSHTLTVQNTTLAGNTATAAGGGASLSVADVATLAADFVSTVVAFNTAPTGPDVQGTANFSFGLVRNQSDATLPNYAVQNNLPANTNPMFVGGSMPNLANNGGPTRTIAIQSGSPLRDAGANPAGLANDQRGPGFPREVGQPDIGAFEFVPNGTPTAVGAFADLTVPAATVTFLVTYSDNTAIDISTVGAGDILVTGPNGYSQAAEFVGVDVNTNGTPRTATYRVTGPGGTFTSAANGTYAVTLLQSAVADTAGNFVPGGPLGTFRVAILVGGTFVVTNANDSGSGSLRAALDAVNAFSTPNDTVVFDPTFFSVPRTISLTSGQLTIADAVTIAGPGAGQLTVRRDPTAVPFRVLAVDVPGIQSVTISGVTIAGGSTLPAAAPGVMGDGAGILLFDEALTLDGVVVTGNTSGTEGGGIAVASYYYGGGGTLVLRNSTISGNQATGPRPMGAFGGAGGGVYFSNGGSLLVENSTVSGNVSVNGNGGGIYFYGPIYAGGVAIRNSTVAGNSAAAGGGGLLIAGPLEGTAFVQNVTVAGNTSTGTGQGGGIAARHTTGEVSLMSTVVAFNTGPSGPDAFGPLTFASSLIRDLNGVIITDGGGNLPAGTDPLFVGGATPTLANNGGPTATVALQAGSPLVNAGANPAGLATDQRGLDFARVAGGGTDIGAFELQPNTPPRVTGVAVNAEQANAAQRSRVTSITVTFNTVVTFAGPVANAFGLSRIGGGAVGGFTVTAATVNGVTVVTLSGFTGAETQFGSLADGRYAFVVRANQVSGGGLQLDGDGDGTGGDDFTLNGTTANGLFRLYGDATGDGTVNAADFAQFRGEFGSSVGQAAYLAFLDLNGDGTINAFDFAQFRTRFGSSVP